MRAALERELPGIAKPVGEDLVAPGLADVGVRGRYPIGVLAGLARIDAQDLAEEAVEPPRRFARRRCIAAVSRRQVEQAVGVEMEPAAVVVGRVRMGDDQDPPARRGIGGDGRTLGPGEFVELDVAAIVDVDDVEQPRLRVVRREGDGEQAFLAAGVRIGLGTDQAANVEEGRRDSFVSLRSMRTMPTFSTTKSRCGMAGVETMSTGSSKAGDLVEREGWAERAAATEAMRPARAKRPSRSGGATEQTHRQRNSHIADTCRTTCEQGYDRLTDGDHQRSSRCPAAVGHWPYGPAAGCGLTPPR